MIRLRFGSENRSAIAVLTALIALAQMASPRAFSIGPPKASEVKVSTADAQKVMELKAKTIASYYNPSLGTELKAGAFDKDLSSFMTYGEQLGIFPESREFREWWSRNKHRFMAPAELEKMKNEPMSAFATAVFLRYSTEKADQIDKADPQTATKKEKGEPTEGDNFVMRTVAQIEENGWSPWLIYTVGGTAVGAGIAVAHKVSDVFFHGPIAQMMNTALEPLIRPVNERITLESNTHIAPRTIPWARWWTGESSRKKRALKKAAEGKELTGDLLRYKHPSISVEDFAKDSEVFYDNMLKADYAWRGWTAPELGRARNTGFELLYHQYRIIGEQLTGYQNATNVNKMLQAQVNRPALQATGASAEEIDEFVKLVNEQQDLMVYKDVKDPKLPEIEAKIRDVLGRWTKKGVPAKTIETFYEAELERIIAENRPAFLLASVLDGERYFQENNLALKHIPEIQKWQEQAREMTGFYDELQMHSDKIQKFFDKRGLKYNVQARIDERGYPLGQDARPANVAPIRDCVKSYLRLIPDPK